MNQDEEHKSDVIADQAGAELAELRAEKCALDRLCGVLLVPTENHDLATAALLAASRIERLEKKIPSLNVDLAEASMHAYNGEIARMKLEVDNARLRKALEVYADEKNWFTENGKIYDIWGLDGNGYSIASEALEVKG